MVVIAVSLKQHSKLMAVIRKIKLSKSNCYLVQGEKNILVDTGNEGESGLIISNLNKYNLALSDISLILHTHGHGDHCGSTVELLKLQKIPTAIHKADSHMCSIGKSDQTINVRLMSKILKPFVSKPFPKFECDFLFDNNFNLKGFGIETELILTPGYTNGSVSLLFSNGNAIVGDLLMGGYLGGKIAPTKPDYHYFATDINQLNSSIDRIINSSVKKLYVGHGGPLEISDVKKWFKQKNPNR